MSPTATESRGTSGAADDPRRPRVGNPSQPSPEERLREADLVERLKQGDEAAFADLVCLHGPRMLAVAKRYVLTESDAEDVLQDALLSAFRAIGSFETKSRLGTWLHTITVNAALMRLRTRRRRPETLVDAGEFEFGASDAGRAAWAFGASEALSRKELRSEVLACLDRLSADFRIVVRLRDMEGMDLAEIGRILDIPVSTVKSRLRRGRAKLTRSPPWNAAIMNCSTIRELLACSIDEPLGPTDRAAMDAHVSGCPACVEWMTRQVLTVEILRGLGAIEEQETPSPLPEPLVRRILAARGDARTQRKRGRLSG